MQNVSPVSLRFTDELICRGVLVCGFVFFCVCWGSFLSLLGSCSSDVLVLEPAAFCYERPRGRIAWLACSVASVSPVPCERRRHSFHSMQRPLVLVFLVVVFAWFGLVSLFSLYFFACLRSFTDWLKN